MHAYQLEMAALYWLRFLYVSIRNQTVGHDCLIAASEIMIVASAEGDLPAKFF